MILPNAALVVLLVLLAVLTAGRMVEVRREHRAKWGGQR